MIGRSSLLALAAAATLTACGDPEPIAVELAVDMTVGTEKAACGVDYALGTGQTTAQLGDGRLCVGVERVLYGWWTVLVG